MADITYAIGDIHGRIDLLERALQWIDEHSRSYDHATIVFLGDYIDRGSRSRQVIERLMEGPSRSSHRFICLLGDHEDMLLRSFTDEKDARATWLSYGGKETLISYEGVIPPSHLAWIERLPLRYDDAHRIFVHAGLNPLHPADGQSRRAMLISNYRFMQIPHDFGKHVVHGHAEMDGKPDLRPFRSNLDTGAVFTGKLCIGIFDPAIPGGPLQTVLIEGSGGGVVRTKRDWNHS